jgi:hypothetical protein
MKRRTITIILGVALALTGSIAACGPGSQNGTAGPGSSGAPAGNSQAAGPGTSAGAAQGDLDQLDQLLNGIDGSLSGADDTATPGE